MNILQLLNNLLMFQIFLDNYKLLPAHLIIKNRMDSFLKSPVVIDNVVA